MKLRGKSCHEGGKFPTSADALASGMSRATAKTHALLQTRKNRHQHLRTIDGSGSASSSTHKSLTRGPAVTMSEDESVRGTRFVSNEKSPPRSSYEKDSPAPKATMKQLMLSASAEESDSSSGIDHYLTYLDKKDKKLEAQSQPVLDHAEEAVRETRAVPNGDEKTKEEPKLQANDTKNSDFPIPTHIAHVRSADHENDGPAVTPCIKISTDQRKMASYAERNRLAQQILLAEHSGRPHRTATAYNRMRVATGSPRHSSSSTSSATLNREEASRSIGSDEFFDAVSRNSDLSDD